MVFGAKMCATLYVVRHFRKLRILVIKYFRYIIFLLFFACRTNENTPVETLNNNNSKQASSFDTTHEAIDNTHQNGDTISQAGEWIFDKVVKQSLIFKNGKSFETNLYELDYIGQVMTANKAPYLIFSGRHCDECDANISVYIHSPSDGPLTIDHGQNRYQYPGNERDFENDSLLYMSRAFYGQVLENKQGVIWYQKTLTEDNTWINDIFLVDITDGKKKEMTMKNLGQLRQTLDLMKNGKCKAIKSMDFTSEP